MCQPSQKWACLETARPASPTPGPYTVTVAKISDVITQQGVAGATVKICRKLDVACSNPVTSLSTAADGSVTFPIEASFAGYLDVTASGYVPTLYFFNPTIDRDTTIPNVPVGTPVANMAILGALGVTPDPTRGTIVVLSLDCTGATAAGVSFATLSGDADSRPFYYVAGLPSATATATTSAGYGGIANVPAGAVTFTSHLASPAVDLPPISLVVRGGALSFSQVVPFGS